jgi:DGQHR domain-containing protein
MKTEIIISNRGHKFLKIELIQFVQKNNAFYVAKMKSDDFLRVYTVRPAQYDIKKHISLANSFPSDDNYYSHLINEDQDSLKTKDFQRDPDEDRIRNIKKFLEEEDFAFFPNTIIANCELINDWSNFNLDENSSEIDFFTSQDRPAFLSFFKKDNDKYFLYVPFEENSILVIDGQHRLVGLERTSNEFQRNYDVLIAFIIGFDR